MGGIDRINGVDDRSVLPGYYCLKCLDIIIVLEFHD